MCNTNAYNNECVMCHTNTYYNECVSCHTNAYDNECAICVIYKCEYDTDFISKLTLYQTCQQYNV
jgi:hypothetical protein